MDNEKMIKRIQAASLKIPCDLVIKNGNIVDVFNGKIIKDTVGIYDGIIVGIGDYEGKIEVDANNKFICPSFINGHVHIESSMLLNKEYVKLMLLHGVTAAIADPHEIANVLGTIGLDFMIQTSVGLPFDIYYMLPSSVPVTDFDQSGAILTADDLEPYYNYENVIGLGEVMNVDDVLNSKLDLFKKVVDAKKRELPIDGHGPDIDIKSLNSYATCDIKTDHEVTTKEEALERITRGFYVHVRQGTIAKDLLNVIPSINPYNCRKLLFVTDDKYVDDIMTEGSIDYNVRLAIKAGVNPILAIQMATINTAECYNIKQGAIAPGYKADLLILDELESIKIDQVYKDGKLVVEQGKLIQYPQHTINFPKKITNTINFKPISIKDFTIPLKTNQAYIMEIVPNTLSTIKKVEKVTLENNHFVSSTKLDQLKVAVIDRHHATGNIGLGIVKGFGIKDGAIASTVAHDSHNLIVTGTNDEDMLFACNELKRIHGGLIIVKQQQVLATLPLSVAGLISKSSYLEVNNQLLNLKDHLKYIGFNHPFNPFMILSFLAIPVIPDLKITTSGLYDVNIGKFIDINAN